MRLAYKTWFDGHHGQGAQPGKRYVLCSTVNCGWPISVFNGKCNIQGM